MHHVPCSELPLFSCNIALTQHNLKFKTDAAFLKMLEEDVKGSHSEPVMKICTVAGVYVTCTFSGVAFIYLFGSADQPNNDGSMHLGMEMC